MKITNKFNLPQALVNACKNDPYTKGDSDFSVTQLINPPQMEYLKSQHGGELVEDVSDRVWALFGSAVHYILERSVQPGDIAEERVFAEIEGVAVSGQFDLIEALTGRLKDYKTVSVWSAKEALANGKQEWNDQLNMLAALLDANGVEVDNEQAAVVAFCRDWRKNEALRYDDYPPTSVEIPISLLSKENRLNLLKQRVILHKQGMEGDYKPCTAHEMWERPATYAVMKEGRKSALRVLDTEADAREWMDKNVNSQINKHSIVLRPGSRVRCEQYCSVSEHCQQYKEHLQVR